MGDFQKGLCDCFDDCGVCLCSFICPCIQFGRNMEAFGSDKLGTSDCCLCCIVYVISHVLYAIPYCILRTMVRQEIRASKGLTEGNALVDCLTIWCCSCCSLAQEAHEVGAAGN